MNNDNNLENRINNILSKNDYDLYPDFPKKNFLIEITNRCNCNCVFCANSKMKRKRQNIDYKFTLRILKEAKDLGVKEVGFYTTGEPLLNKDLNSYIKYAKDIGYEYVYITTNGILLNKQNIKLLSDSGIDSIKLSINAIDEKEYEFIHGINKFDLVISNLKNLFEYRMNNDKNFKIYVSYIITKYNTKTIDEIKNYFKDYCDEVVVIPVRNQSGMMPEINKYLLYEGKNTVDSKRKLPCNYVFNSINVTCEGYLTACCTDFENLLVYADLNKESLKDAWQNDIITNLRKKHLENNLEDTLCNNCIYDSCDKPKPLIEDFSSNNVDIISLDDIIENRIIKLRKREK